MSRLDLGRLARAGAIAILAGAAVAIRLSYLRRTLVYPYDSYYYLGTARSLVEHGIYSFRGFPHTRFLPLYPVLTALGATVLGVERAGRIIPPLAWGGVVVLSYLLGRRLFSEWVGLTGAILLVAQPIGVKWASVPMSEAVFTLTLLAAVLAAVVAAQDERPRLLALAGALGGVSMLARYEGVVVLPVVIALAWRHSRARWPLLVGLALLVGLPLAWAARSALVHAPDQSYASELQANLLAHPSVVVERLRYYARDAWLNQGFAWAAWAGLVLAGLRRTWRVGAAVLGAWLGFFVVGHVAWYYVYERFMVPALPAAALLAGALVVSVVEAVGLLLSREGLRPGLALLLGVPLVMGAVAHDVGTARAVTDSHILTLSDDWGGGVSREAAARLRDEKGAGDALATDSGALVAYYADAPTYYLTFKEGQTVDRPDLTSSGLPLLRDLQARHVRWLVVQVPTGSTDARAALSGFGLANGGLTLAHVYAAPPIEVAVFRVPAGTAAG